MIVKLKIKVSRSYLPLTENRRFIPARETVSDSSAQTCRPCAFVGAGQGDALFDAEVEGVELQPGSYRLRGFIAHDGTLLWEGRVDISAPTTTFEVILRLSFSPEGFVAVPEQKIDWRLESDPSKPPVAEAGSSAEVYFLAASPVPKDPGGLPVGSFRTLAEFSKTPELSASKFTGGFLTISSLSHLGKTVNGIFNYNPPRYDIYRGSPHFTQGNLNNITLFLARYLQANNDSNSLVNCNDEAGVVQYYLQGIASPTTVFYCYIEPFGYLATTDLVGRGLCNNPNYGATGTPPTVEETDGRRGYFKNHTFCLIKSTHTIADSTVGPHTGNESLASFLDAAIDKKTPIPADIEPGTCSDVERYAGVIAVSQLTGSMMEDHENIEQFKEAIGFDDSKLTSTDSDLFFPHHPPLEAHPLLREGGWEVGYHEIIPGYPESSKYWRLQSGSSTIEFSVFVSNDGVATARRRFFSLGSFHSMTGPIFGPGPDSLGEFAAAFSDPDRKRMIWVDRNLTFDLTVANADLDAEAIAAWCQDSIRSASNALEGAGPIEFSDEQAEIGQVVSAKAGRAGGQIYPLLSDSAASFRVVDHANGGLDLVALEPGDFVIPLVVVEPNNLCSEYFEMQLKVE